MTTTTTTILLTLIFLTLAGRQAGAEEPQRSVHSIPGPTLKVIQAAMPRFEERGLKLDAYVVSVFEQDSSFVVVFDDPNRATGRLGSTPDRIAFEVGVSKQGLRAVRANFVR